MEKTLSVTMKIDFSGTETELFELEKILENHIDWFVNMDEFPEITAVHDVNVKEDKNND